MSELTEIAADEVSMRFSEVLAEVESEGKGFVVIRAGRPIARILPIERQPVQLTAQQEAALHRVMTTGWPLGIGKLDREELYDR